MKLIFALSALFLGACASTPTAQTVTLSAIEDFTIPENSGLYVDKKRSALAIGAGKPEYRNVLIGASHVVDWLEAPQSFGVTLTYNAEKDGESRFELWVNGAQSLGAVGAETDEEFEETSLEMGSVQLSPGDRLEMKSMAVTNGKIPEGDGTAYSRGRWIALTLTPVQSS